MRSSRLDKVESKQTKKPKLEKFAELYALDDEDLPTDAFPITYSNILKISKKIKNY